MTDGTWKRNEVDSPCVRICTIHPETGLCVGCARSIAEISRWSRMDAAERQAIIAELPTRAAAPTRRRGGRAARINRT